MDRHSTSKTTGVIISLVLVSLVICGNAARAGFYLKYQIDGDVAGDELGVSVANAGDVNGDSIPDFIIGADRADPGGITDAGYAFVYDGATGNLLYQKDGSSEYAKFGWSVCTAGDVNNDGNSDFIIGAYGAAPGGLTDAGSAFVYDGATGNLLYQKDGTAEGDYFGFAVSTAGDVNNDGYSDFIVGAYGAEPGGLLQAGSAYVYDGATGNLLYQKDGTAEGDYFGFAVSTAGDVNNDGSSDFIVGSYYADPGGLNQAGSAYVYDGATGNLLYQKDGSSAGDSFGFSVSSAGDVNADNYSDFIIGAFTASPGGISVAGSAYVYDGATGNLLYQKDGTAANDNFGYSVSTGGDINGDGFSDFIIGAYYADPGGVLSAGSAYVYDGNTGNLLGRLDGASADDMFGNSVSTVGDLNGDGKSGFIVGAYQADPGGLSAAGTAYVYEPDFATPTVTDNQTGDDTWYSSDPGAIFDVDFADTGGALLNNVQYTVWDSPTMASGSEIIAWTDIAAGINSASYTTNWAVDFATLPGGISYVSVRAYDNANNVSAVATDVFYVRKDISSPTIIDNQAGDDTWYTSDPGAIFDVDFSDTGGSLLDTAEYTAWSEAAMSGSEIVTWTPIIAEIYSSSFTTNWGVNFASLSEGVNYISVRVRDFTGNSSAVATDVFYVKKDITAPADISAIHDGTGADIDFSSSTTELSANWTDSSDDQSGIATYIYTIGTIPGASDTIDWTESGTSTYFVSTGLSLVNGSTYYTTVQAENGASLLSAILSSDGVTIDTTPPTTPLSVYDDDGVTPGFDIDITTTGTQLSSSWDTSSDPESGITGYWYAIGTSQGATDVVDWTDNSTSTSVTNSGLVLTNGTSYFTSVHSVNGAGIESSIGFSDGVMADVPEPVQSNWSPATGTTIATTSVIIAFNTDQTAECRWSLTDLGYSSISPSNDCSGAGTTSHACDVSGLSEGSQVVHTACTGLHANADLDTTNEDLTYIVDTTPPSIDTISPATGTVITTASATITFYSDENATCRWSLTDDAYSSMSNTCSGGGTTTHSCTASGLSEGSVFIYVACSDTVGNETTADTNEDLYYTVDTSTPAQGGHDPAAGTLLTINAIILTFTTDENATCKWALSDLGYAAMAGGNTCTGVGTTSQTCSVTGLPEGSASVYTSCQDSYGNEDSVDTNWQMSYIVDTTAPSIIDNQAGDEAWYTADPGAVFDVDFADGPDGALLSSAEYSMWAGPQQSGAQLVSWATIASTINAATYTTNWGIDFTAATDGYNYISVRTTDNAAWSSSSMDVFYVKKDTLPPTGGALSYITGYSAYEIVDTSFTFGADAGSGVSSRAIQRASATLSVGSCGSFGTWTDVTTSPYEPTWSDTSVKARYCYAYRLKETDAVGNFSYSCIQQDCETWSEDYAVKVSSSNGALAFTAGDISQNGQVNIVDLAIMKTYFGTTSATCDQGDVNEDGKVDLMDLLTIKGNYLDIAGNGGTYELTSATSAASLSLSASQPYIYQGATVTVDVMLNSGGALLDGFDIHIDFPVAVLSAADVTAVPPSGFTEIATLYDNASGTISISMVNMDTVLGTFNDSIATITFTALQNATASLSFAQNPPANRMTSGLESTTSYVALTTTGLEIGPETSPPSAPAYVYDGTGADAAYSTSTTALDANWAASTDPESGVSGYWICAGTTAGASDTAGWTSAGTGTAYTLDGLALTGGQTYYVSVKAENGAGLFSTTATSDGVIIDNTEPSAPSPVNDGTGADEDFTAATNSLSANWAQSRDAESGLAEYKYAIGTTAGGAEVAGWSSAGTATGATVTKLALTPGQTYYFSVKAVNGAGLTGTAAISDGITVASGEPSSTITQPQDGAYLNSLTSVYGTATDTNAVGLEKVDVYIQDLDASTYWTGSSWQAGAYPLTASGTTSWSLSSSQVPTWSDGVQYTISSIATDMAGIAQTATASNTFTYDTTAPAISITSPSDGLKTTTSSVQVSGTTESGATVKVNGTAASVTGTTFSKTITLSEGSNTITATATDLAGNQSSDSVTASLDTTAPTAQITSPSSGTSQSGTVTVSGTASDSNFQGYTLEYGIGSAPSLWTQFGSGSQQVASGTLGTLDASAFSGTYTIKLTVTDTHGNTSSTTVSFTVAGTPITLKINLSEDEWTQMALPMAPDSTTSNALTGGTNYNVYIWNPTLESDPIYQKFERPSSVMAGQGMWIKAMNDDTKFINLSGSPVDTTTAYEYTVYQGWNQIGTPFNWNFSWSGIGIKQSGTVYTLDQNTQEALISSSPFYYQAGDSQWRMLASNGTMKPGEGFMLYVFENGVSLQYEPSGGGTTAARVIRPRPQFEVKISATARNSADPDNFIGLARAASDGFDGSDIVEPPAGMSANYTTLYFPHDDWQGRPARYAADYRDSSGVDSRCNPAPESGICKVWDFKVATNEKNNTVTLTWDSLEAFSGGYDITLEDLATGAEVDMTATSSYSYTADGTVHNFRITVAVQGPAPKTVTHTLNPGWNLVAIPVDPETTDAISHLADNLPAMDIYQFFDGEYYSTIHEEGVDIQTGLGYWIHVDANLEIDITGVPVDPLGSVDVPLEPGWNLIGNPFEAPLAWGDNINVTCNGNTAVLSQAVSHGWIKGNVYTYTEGGYTGIAPGGSLDPWTGYYIQVSGRCELELKQ